MARRDHQPRDTRGRFSTKQNTEGQMHLTNVPEATSPAALSAQLSRTAALQPGAAADALKSPSSAIRACAKVIGWDLPAKIREQFSRDERQVLQVVRPDLVA